MIRVRCRKGLPLSFTVTVKSGIDARYTRAKFQVRTAFDDTLPALLSVDETNGITITAGVPGTVQVSIGAIATQSMALPPAHRDLAAELRVYNPDDANDRDGWVIPFLYEPDAIDD